VKTSLLRNLGLAVKGNAHQPRQAPSSPTVAPPRRRRVPVAVGAGQDTANGFVGRAVTGFDTASEETRDQCEGTHVSYLLRNPCPRHVCLVKKFSPTLMNKVRPGVRIIWALGRAVETHVRKALAKTMPDVMYGGWECKCERTHICDVRSVAQARRCPECGGTPNTYKELLLEDLDRGMIGSPDVLLKLPIGFVVIECKSVNLKGYTKVQEVGKPDADHRNQALCYRRIMERNGYDVAPFVVVLYVLKDYQFRGSPYTEFQCTEDDVGAKTALNLMDTTAEIIQDSIQEQAAMPGRLSACTESTSRRAKDCSTCTLCFSV